MKRWVLRYEETDYERERECFTRVEGVELMPVVEWCVSGAKDLRFVGREFHKRGEELRNDRLGKLEPGGDRWKEKTR